MVIVSKSDEPDYFLFARASTATYLNGAEVGYNVPVIETKDSNRAIYIAEASGNRGADHVKIPFQDASLLDGCTIELRVYVTSAHRTGGGVDHNFFSLYNGTKYLKFWHVGSDNKFYLSIYNGSGWYSLVVDTATNIPVGWHSFTFTLSSTGGMTAYMDGTQKATDPSTYILPGSDGYLFIGSDGSGGVLSDFANTHIRDFVFSTVVRTGTSIAYRAGTNFFPIDTDVEWNVPFDYISYGED